MATVVRKAVKKKASEPKEIPVLVFELTQDRVTSGAYRYKEDEPKDGSEMVSGSLYLRKAHLDGVNPKRVRVTVEILEVAGQ